MKKLLLASTALVATAGVAAAEVALSGFAEMGVKRQINSDVAEFHTDIGVTFSLSGETDNGISFGGSIALEEAQDGIITDADDDFSVFISSGGATLTMGDTDGAFDRALTEVNVGGASSIADDHTTHAGFSGNGGFGDDDPFVPGTPAVVIDESLLPNGDTTSDGDPALGLDIDGDGEIGTIEVSPATADEDGSVAIGMGLDGNNDGQIARFDYSFGDFGFSASAEMDDTEALEPIWGLGFTYAAELSGVDLGLGLGWQTQSDFGQVWGGSISAGWANGLTGVINYSQFTADDTAVVDRNHFGIGLGYVAGAISVGINWGQYTAGENQTVSGVDVDNGDVISSGFGFAAAYDFGGGLEAQFGYGSSMYDDDVADAVGFDDSTADSFSLGLSMSF